MEDDDYQGLRTKLNHLSHANDQLRREKFDLEHRIRNLTNRIGFESLEEAEQSQNISVTPDATTQKHLDEALERIKELEADAVVQSDRRDREDSLMAKEFRRLAEEKATLSQRAEDASKYLHARDEEVQRMRDEFQERLDLKDQTIADLRKKLAASSENKENRHPSTSHPLRESTSNRPNPSNQTPSSVAATTPSISNERLQFDLAQLKAKFDKLHVSKQRLAARHEQHLSQWKNFKAFYTGKLPQKDGSSRVEPPTGNDDSTRRGKKRKLSLDPEREKEIVDGIMLYDAAFNKIDDRGDDQDMDEVAEHKSAPSLPDRDSAPLSAVDHRKSGLTLEDDTHSTTPNGTPPLGMTAAPKSPKKRRPPTTFADPDPTPALLNPGLTPNPRVDSPPPEIKSRATLNVKEEKSGQTDTTFRLQSLKRPVPSSQSPRPPLAPFPLERSPPRKTHKVTNSKETNNPSTSTTNENNTKPLIASTSKKDKAARKLRPLPNLNLSTPKTRSEVPKEFKSVRGPQPMTERAPVRTTSVISLSSDGGDEDGATTGKRRLFMKETEKLASHAGEKRSHLTDEGDAEDEGTDENPFNHAAKRSKGSSNERPPKSLKGKEKEAPAASPSHPRPDPHIMTREEREAHNAAVLKKPHHEYMKEYTAYKGRGRYGKTVATEEEGINARYEIDKNRNEGLGFQFDEVVRNKEARKKLHGVDCPCCKDYYDAVGPVAPRLEPPLWRSPSPGSTPRKKRHTAKPSTSGEIQQHKQDISRHRHNWVPPTTPPRYWHIGFPDSQEVAEINKLAKEQRLAKEQYLEVEASKKDGKYKRKK